jgi:hypothetical protein
MSWTDAPTFHYDLPFIPLHHTYAPFTSSPKFTSLPFSSLHVTSLQCIFLFFPPHLHFALFIIFLTFFLKLLDLQERVPKASAGTWFQSWMVLFTNDFFHINICKRFRKWTESSSYRNTCNNEN